MKFAPCSNTVKLIFVSDAPRPEIERQHSATCSFGLEVSKIDQVETAFDRVAGVEKFEAAARVSSRGWPAASECVRLEVELDIVRDQLLSPHHQGHPPYIRQG